MKKIISISLQDNFLKTFTDHILYQKGVNDYSRICIVAPGKRTVLYLQKHLSCLIKSSFFPPDMLTINEFIHSISEREYKSLSMIEEIDALWQIYNIILESPFASILNISKGSEEGFLFEYAWIRKIYQFINQIDKEDISDQVLKNIQANAEIGYSVPENINNLFKNIIAVRNRFHEWLKQNRIFTGGYSYLKAKDLIEETSFNEYDQIYFIGLFALTKTEKLIINHLLQKGRAQLIWHGDPEEWGILQEQADYFQQEIEYYTSLKKEHTQNIKIYSSFDFHSETEQVYNILRTQEQIKDTVIVAPINDTLFPLLSFAIDRLISEEKIDKFNISLDYPINKTSLFTFIKDVISCQLNIRKSDKGNLYYTKVYLQILMNPFVKNMIKDKLPFREIVKQIQNFFTDPDSSLYNMNFIHLDIVKNSLNDEFQDIMDQFHQIFFINLEDVKSLSDMCERLDDILHYIISLSEVRSYILSGEIINLLYSSFLNIKNTGFAKISFSLPKSLVLLWDFLLKFIEDNLIKFNTVPLQDLEIIGVLETRNLNFSNVIILDMQEGVLPVERKIDPLIPVSILKDIGLPSLDFQDEIYEYYFYRLVRNSDSVHLLYRETPENDRSRYIERIIWEDEIKNKKLQIKKVQKARFKINLMMDTHKQNIIKDKYIIKKIHEIEYSPSCIDTYLFCQVKFYYNHILGLSLPEQISTDLDVLDRGRLIHDVLHDLFKKFQKEYILSKDLSKIKEEFDRVFQHVFADKVHSGEYYLFKKMAYIKLNQFLENHISGMLYPFKVIHTEKSFKSEYILDKKKIILKGRIDRIDSIKNQENEIMIIDYKTGNSSVQKRFQYIPDLSNTAEVETIRNHVQSFQLPIYLYLYLNQNEIPLNLIDAKLIYLGDLQEERLLQNNTDMDQNDVYQYYQSLLKTVLSEIFNPDVPFIRYKDVSCEYCEFCSTCKYK